MTRRRLGVAGLALLISAAGAALYATRLEEAPIYLAHDEIKFALQAHAIATTGRDINGLFMPLFFSEPGFSAGRDPVSIYVTALFLELLPFSESSIRLPTAVVGLLNIVLMFFLAHRIFKRLSFALVAAALLALTPIHFIYARFGLDVVYPLSFLMAWLLCLVGYLESGSLKRLFAAMMCLGFGGYSYLAFLVMTPVYVALTGFTLRAQRSWRPYAAAAAGFALPLLPLVLWHLRHHSRYGDLVGAYRLYDAHRSWVQGFTDLGNVSSLGMRADVYWNFFNPSFLFFSGDSSVLNSTRQVGVFLLPVAILLPLGVYWMLSRRRTAFNVLLLWGFVSAPLAAVLLGEVAIRRALVMVPFAVLIAAFGFECLLTAPARTWRLAAVVVVLALPVQFWRFYVDYFGSYRVSSSVWFGGNVRGAVTEIIERAQQRPMAAVYLSSGIPYVDAYWDFYVIKRGIALSRRTVSCDPGRQDLQAAPPQSLLLCAMSEPPHGAGAASGEWKLVKLIIDPNGTPGFSVYQK